MISVDIDRMNLSLHGISSAIVEQSIQGLEDELHRRLGVLANQDMASFDITTLSIGPIKTDMKVDATTLRHLIADRIVEVIHKPGFEELD